MCGITGFTYAKAKIIGQRKIGRQDLGGVATATALDELYGLGFGYNDAEDAKIEAVTLAEVRAAAQKYLRPNAAIIAVINPEPQPGAKSGGGAGPA